MKSATDRSVMSKAGIAKSPSVKTGFFKFGRRERIRTSDPLVPNQLRYQAALLAEIVTALLLLTASFRGAKGGT